jgi:hypothetical protein
LRPVPLRRPGTQRHGSRQSAGLPNPGTGALSTRTTP